MPSAIPGQNLDVFPPMQGVLPVLAFQPTGGADARNERGATLGSMINASRKPEGLALTASSSQITPATDSAVFPPIEGALPVLAFPSISAD